MRPKLVASTISSGRSAGTNTRNESGKAPLARTPPAEPSSPARARHVAASRRTVPFVPRIAAAEISVLRAVLDPGADAFDDPRVEGGVHVGHAIAVGRLGRRQLL